MNDGLSKILEENRAKIIDSWAKKLKRLGKTSFSRQSPEKLKSTWAKGYEAYLSAIKEGKYAQVRNFIERISTLRGSPDFNLSEIQKSFLTFKEVLWPFVKKEYKTEINGLLKALEDLDSSVNSSLYEISQVYERHVETKLKSYTEQISQLDEKLEDISLTDGLTGLFTNRYFQQRLSGELSRAKRYGRPLALALFDIDNFRQYNETYGAPNGDLLLKKVTEILTKSTRDVDVWARFGGEELVVAFPETDKMDATIVAERLRKSVEESSFSGQESQPGGKITISGGVVSFPHEAQSQEELINLLENLLAQAKQKGRNQIYFLLK